MTINRTNQTIDATDAAGIAKLLAELSPEQKAILTQKLVGDLSTATAIANELAPKDLPFDAEQVVKSAEGIISCFDQMEDEGRKLENDEGIDWDVKMLRDSVLTSLHFKLKRLKDTIRERGVWLLKQANTLDGSEVREAKHERSQAVYMQMKRRYRMWKLLYRTMCEHAPDYREIGSAAGRMSANVLVTQDLVRADAKEFGIDMAAPTQPAGTVITRSRG